MKISQRSRGAAAAGGRERILVRVDVPAIRHISALMLFSVLGGLTILVVRHHLGYDRVAPGRFGWSVALFVALALIARGIFLGRPVTTGHTMMSAATVCAGLGAHFLSFGLFGNMLVAGSGLVLMLPTAAQPQPQMLKQVWRWSTLPAAIRWRPLPCIEQELSLQHRQDRGDRFPHPAWVRRSQRRPDRRCHPIRQPGNRFRRHVPQPRLADHRVGLRPPAPGSMAQGDGGAADAGGADWPRHRRRCRPLHP